MQDNNPQPYDEQFIGQAWLEMKKLLDKEMPVRPKRRPAWWLWILAGLLLVVLSGGVYYFVAEQGKPAPVRSTPAPTARLDQASANPEKGTDKKAATPQPAEEALPTTPGPTSTYTGSQPPQWPSTPTTGQKQRPSATAALPMPPLSEEEQRPGFASSEENKPETALPASTAPLPLPEGSGQPPVLAVTGLLPLNPVLVQPTAQWKEESVLPPILHRQPRLLRVALEGSAYFPGLAGSGGGAGLALEAHPRRSRLYLRTGVHVSAFRQNLDTENNTIQLENSFTKTPLPDGTMANSQSRLSASTTIETARYLQVPLLAGFQLWPRLAVETGIQANFLLSSTARSSWNLENENNLSEGPGQNNTIYETTGTAGTPFLNATLLELTAGLAYRAGRRTSVRMHYQYGLSNILKSTQDEAFIRGLRLSLAYYIVK